MENTEKGKSAGIGRKCFYVVCRHANRNTLNYHFAPFETLEEAEKNKPPNADGEEGKYWDTKRYFILESDENGKFEMNAILHEWL